ncbi:MAG: toxin-antitoxin system HicB family antitoxin [Verrucomicrobia bacterium]|nr:toxin-antitoxin system HicB family antitoxin [Verrucomicrobiota bacterium]
MTPQTRASALRKQVLPDRYHGRVGGKAAKRTKALSLRLTAEEHAALAAKAKSAGVSINDLLRQLIQQSRIYNHRGQERWYAVLLSLRAHLATLSDKAAEYGPANAAVLLAYVAAIARHLEGITHDAR